MIGLINSTTSLIPAARRNARFLCMGLVLAVMLAVMTAGCSNDKPTVSRESGKMIHDYCDKSDAAAGAVVRQLEAAGVLDPGARPRSAPQRIVRPSTRGDVYLRWNLATYDAPLWSASADLLSYVVSRAVRKAEGTLASPTTISDTFVFTIGFSDRNLRGLAESLEVVRLVVPVRLADEGRQADDPSWDAGDGANLSVPAVAGDISVVHEDDPDVYQDLVGVEKPGKPEEYVPKEEPLAAAGPRQASGVRAKLAIVIDDLGNGVAGTEQLFQLKVPLTVAVLPDGRRAGSEATTAGERGFAVLLHQPMEPHDPAKRPGGGAIMADMSQEEIRRVLAANLAAVPYVIGVSNHMGSKVTENRDAMNTIMDEVFSRGLFFFDSRTTPDSAAPRVARDMGAPLLENARFLDHIADETYVVDQIRAAARIALSRGSAAVIGHVRPTTVRALARMIPELEAAGVQLVRLDELMPAGWKSTVVKLRRPTEEPTAGASLESSAQPQPQSGGAAASPQETTDSPALAPVPTETGHEAAAPTEAQPVPAGDAPLVSDEPGWP
jgi:polysaccharide deacetylase 2 family uncharacterized protein YibQ